MTVPISARPAAKSLPVERVDQRLSMVLNSADALGLDVLSCWTTFVRVTYRRSW
jgi:hypothetical protein